MSLTSLPPGSEQSMDVVSCKVFINNNELNNEVLLLQFSVSKVFNKISTAKLIFRDGSVA